MISRHSVINLLLLFVFCCNSLGTHGYDCMDVKKHRCIHVSDKWVTVSTRHNHGTTSIDETKSYTVGNSKSNSSNTGTHGSETDNSNTETSVGGNAGFSVFGISLGVQGSFAESVGKSSTTGFDWSQSSSDTFDSHMSSSISYSCPARRTCKVMQVVGVCDGCEFKTSETKFVDEMILPNTTVSDQLEKNITNAFAGETSITIKNITYTERSGDWERAETCQGGTRVHGFQLKSQRRKGMTGFMLICAGKDEQSDGLLQNKTQIQSGEGSLGTWAAPFRSYFENTYATGFAYQTWESTRGQKYKGNWKLIMERERTQFHSPDWAVKLQAHETHCPRNYEICGIQTMLSNDKKVITDIGFKCCYHCEPREAFVVRDSYINNAGNAFTLHNSWSEGIRNSHDTNKGGNTHTDISEQIHGLKYTGLQAGFQATLGSSASNGFNWGQSDSRMWNTDQTKDIRWRCPGFNQCTLKQLVGFCGNEEVVRTPLKVIDSVRLPDFETLTAAFNSVNQQDDDYIY